MQWKWLTDTSHECSDKLQQSGCHALYSLQLQRVIPISFMTLPSHSPLRPLGVPLLFFCHSSLLSLLSSGLFLWFLHRDVILFVLLLPLHNKIPLVESAKYKRSHLITLQKYTELSFYVSCIKNYLQLDLFLIRSCFVGFSIYHPDALKKNLKNEKEPVCE